MTSYGEELSAGELLQLVEKLHKQFEDEVISFEDFEEQKAELMARLPVIEELAQLTLSRSTTKTSVSLGPITPPAPRVP